MNRPESTLAVVRAILRIGARRSLNRVLVRLGKRRSQRKDGRRRATAPRSGAWWLLSAIIYAGVLLLGIRAASSFLGSVSGLVCHPGRIGVASFTYRLLLECQAQHTEAGASSGPAGERGDPPPLPEDVQSALHDEAQLQAMGQPDPEQIQNRLVEQYRRRGAEGFYERKSLFVLWPGRDLWPEPRGEPAMLAVLSGTLSVLAIMLVLFGFSQYGRDLTAVHWSTEWFFTFPARARAIFLADVLQSSVLNFMAWLTVFPLMLAVLGSCGYGVWALVPAAGCTLYLSALAGGVCMLGETWMRRHFTAGRLRSVQATATLLTTLGLFGMMILNYPFVMGPVSTFAAGAAACPRWVTWLPCGVPLLLTQSPQWAAGGAGAMVVLALLAAAAATWLSERLVRRGLVAHPAMPSARRSGALSKAQRAPRLRGVLGREIRLILRDRNLLTNTVIVPLALAMTQVLLQHRLLVSARGDLHHTATVAFFIGCYVILVGGVQVLASEARSLWMLYTFPRGLEWVLLRKVAMWAAFAGTFALGILVYGLHSAGGLSAGAAVPCLVAIWGVLAFAFIDCGISILNCRLPQGAEKARVGPGAAYLCMILAGLYAGALYTNNWWNQAVWAVLFAMLGAAIWQLVRDRVGYLLDTTAKPPPALSIAHGLLSAFAFFSIQGILLVLLVPAGMSVPAALTVSYALAGGIVALTALAILRRVPNLLRIVGLAGDRPRTMSPGPAVLAGLALGVLAAILGAGYLLLCRQFPSLWRLGRESFPCVSRGMSRLSLVGLVVILAPLLEEFIFRGLLFRGLERMVRPVLAVVGSAAIFAVIHPPISIAPVFVLGLAAAAGFRKTGLLLAPISTHAAYNGLIFLAGQWLAGT